MSHTTHAHPGSRMFINTFKYVYEKFGAFRISLLNRILPRNARRRTHIIYKNIFVYTMYNYRSTLQTPDTSRISRVNNHYIMRIIIVQGRSVQLTRFQTL